MALTRILFLIALALLIVVGKMSMDDADKAQQQDYPHVSQPKP